jgi:hypothetical protein
MKREIDVRWNKELPERYMERKRIKREHGAFG